MSLTAAEKERYSRHISLHELGIAGQQKLKAARVLVIGAGGLGSPSALYLAAAGIGTLGILDHDRVDLSNLQRQVLYASAEVGELKAEAAARRLRALNPDIEVIAHPVELRAHNVREILGAYDLVLDGTDRFSTRYLSNDACVLLGKPLVSAAIHRFEGQAMSYVPGRGPCYRCLFAQPPADGMVPNCAEAGVLGVLPGVLGTIQASEAIKIITGIGKPLLGRLLSYDALAMRFDEFSFARRADCAVCGDQPSILEPADAPAACGVEILERIRRLQPRELQLLLAEPGVVPVDVREPHEWSHGSLPGSLRIPLTELAARIGELPPGSTPVFYCASGVRSISACAIAATAGIADLAHLEGGLKAWTSKINARA